MLRSLTLTMAAAALAISGSVPAAAQDYPSRPVRIIVGFAPGGIVDEVARYLGEYITRETGQPAIVENAPGAAGATSLRTVARAEPDGYTIGVAISGNLVISPFVQKTMPLDVMSELTHVAALVEAPNFIAIGPSVTARSAPEFIAFAKAKKGGITYGSPGVGSLPHLSAATFAHQAGIETVHVPYRGATPAILDLMAGKIDFVSSSYGDLRAGVDNKSLNVLFVASKQRASSLPDIPAAPEVGLPDFEVSTWLGVVGPKGLPPATTAKLNALVNRMLADPGMQKRLKDRYMEALSMTQPQFASFVSNEYAKWGKRVRDLGIEPE